MTLSLGSRNEATPARVPFAIVRKNSRTMARIICFVAVLFFAGGAAFAQSAADRGRYLATLGDCAVCHTAPGAQSTPYAGGYPLHAIFGTVYSTNITPDKTTGIGNWTSGQFYHALHDGIAADGHHLYPAFPYPYFAAISRADSDAIFAYLRTVKPVHYKPPPNQLIFPTNIRALMAFWDALFLSPDPVRYDTSKSAEWNHGNAIVNGIGHCGGCHSPKTLLFVDKAGEHFRGETIDGWYAPNLTGSMRTGLGRWTAADIAQFLKTGSNRFGRVLGSMQDVVRVSTSRWTDADREAVAAYLKSLPAAPEAMPSKPDAQAMENGQRTFVERCAVCHASHSKDYPPLAGNAIVQASDPTSILRVILQGSQSAPTPNGPIGFSMPAFPGLDDRDLADVATYIRNSWGNRAKPVSTADAKSVRHLIGADRAK